MNVTKNFMITFLIVTSSLIFSENLKPYILASKSNEPLEQIVDLLQTGLTENNFEILGQYSPASGEKGEGHFLPIIDITSPKHTAFLPYELLIVDGKAVMMHGRYRIALSFPDLTMGTFSKIMSTPGDIKKALKKYTE